MINTPALVMFEVEISDDIVSNKIHSLNIQPFVTDAKVPKLKLGPKLFIVLRHWCIVPLGALEPTTLLYVNHPSIIPSIMMV